MRCLPAFILLLLVVSSAPGVDVRSKTKNIVTLASLRDFAKKTLKRISPLAVCCPRRFPCCDIREKETK
nr:TPA_inf: conotoxin precursor T [Conus judaeus]